VEKLLLPVENFCPPGLAGTIPREFSTGPPDFSTRFQQVFHRQNPCSQLEMSKFSTVPQDAYYY